MKPEETRIWALLGPHRGDNNQVIALAEALGLPFEAITLRYNRLRWLQPRLLGATFRSLTRESRAAVAGDPPDLIISTGHRSVPVVQAIRRRSGGRTRSVHLGYPRLSPARFDLVVPTPEYPVPDDPNVLRIPYALSRTPAQVEKLDATFLEGLPAPRRLLILGGPTLYWKLDEKEVLQALSRLTDVAADRGGSVMVVGSPRTNDAILHAVERALAESPSPVRIFPVEGPPTYAALLASADSIFVTADSVAMVSDAILTAKPVGLLPIRPSLFGRAYMGLAARLRPGKRLFPRDLRFFWAALEAGGLVGTLEQPRGRPVPDLAAMVAERVRGLLRGG